MDLVGYSDYHIHKKNVQQRWSSCSLEYYCVSGVGKLRPTRTFFAACRAVTRT